MGTLANSEDPDDGTFAWKNHIFFLDLKCNSLRL